MPEDTTASVTPQTGAEPGQQAGGVASAGAGADSTTATPKPTTETTEERRFTQAELDKLVKQRLAEERAKRDKQAEAEKLAASGEYQKLADQYKAQADGLTTELEALKAQLADAAAAVEATYQARLAGLPKEAKKAVESLPGLTVAQKLAWLDSNAALFARPTPPNINATDQGATSAAQRKATEQELWRRWGLNNAVRAAQQQDK